MTNCTKNEVKTLVIMFIFYCIYMYSGYKIIHILITFSFRLLQCCLIHKPWLSLICLYSYIFVLHDCILFLSVTCSRANKESVECRDYRWQPHFHTTEKVSRNIFRRREVHLYSLGALIDFCHLKEGWLLETGWQGFF